MQEPYNNITPGNRADASRLNGNFAAIDFETANGRRSSVCSVGVVIVRGGQIVDRFYSLIRPVPNYYTDWTTDVHGLTRRDTDSQPTFPEVWAQVADRIKGLPLVAHNRPFDESCLKAVFDEYDMEYPDYEFHCTLAASRRCLDLPSHQLHISARMRLRSGRPPPCPRRRRGLCRDCPEAAVIWMICVSESHS